MFTGIVTATCAVEKIIVNGESSPGARLQVQHDYPDIIQGESIAVNGVCLTAMPLKPRLIAFDVSPETLRCSTLGLLNLSDTVNLERSLSLSDRLGGHFVTGHVDQVCQVGSVKPQGDFTELVLVGVSVENRAYLLPKGSVAINGVSLTVNAVSADSFCVVLIPETMKRTNLSAIDQGESVNVEFDMLAKIVCRQLALNH